MMIRAVIGLLLSAVVSTAALARVEPKADRSKKKVLVELYTSQGCNSCPPASEFFGKLAALGYGPDRIVPIGFHVDYFNDPWKDPYPDPVFSRRQLEYNEVQRRKDLYFTPMMMVDGRTPMLGSDRPKALAAIKKALDERPAVALRIAWEGVDDAHRLSVQVTSQAPETIDRDLLVGVAVVEDPVSTRVPSGENAGKTLVEHFVARSFQHQFTRLDRDGSKTLAFPLKLSDGAIAARTRVAVFVQDQTNGKVYQADALSWVSTASRSKAQPRTIE